MGYTHYAGGLAAMAQADFRYAQRFIEKQTGLRLDRAQVDALWRTSGSKAIVAEVGVIRPGICIAMVDILCNRLVGTDWPLNGDQGEDGAFFHRFTTAAIAAGYEVPEREAA